MFNTLRAYHPWLWIDMLAGKNNHKQESPRYNYNKLQTVSLQKHVQEIKELLEGYAPLPGPGKNFQPYTHKNRAIDFKIV
jgi:hypothetical protein